MMLDEHLLMFLLRNPDVHPTLADVEVMCGFQLNLFVNFHSKVGLTTHS